VHETHSVTAHAGRHACSAA
ncbi:MAG: hypothetical protein AVDCRST_MAG26-333, partial [uncultured Chloroflexia bacterium]